MSLVIEAEVLILVNPDRWDRPKFGDIAERRDGGEGGRLRKNEVLLASWSSQQPSKRVW